MDEPLPITDAPTPMTGVDAHGNATGAAASSQSLIPFVH